MVWAWLKVNCTGLVKPRVGEEGRLVRAFLFLGPCLDVVLWLGSVGKTETKAGRSGELEGIDNHPVCCLVVGLGVVKSLISMSSRRD